MSEPTTAPPSVPALTHRLAMALGETDPWRRDRLDRVVRCLGTERAFALLDRAQVLAAGGEPRRPTALGATSLAAVFFYLVQEEASPAERAAIFVVPPAAGPAARAQRVGSNPARTRGERRIGCSVFVLALGLLEHAVVGGFTYFSTVDFSMGDYPPVSSLPHYAHMAWVLWGVTIAAIVGCAIAGVIVRSGWRWAPWGGVLLLPIAWLVLVDAAFKSGPGDASGEGTSGVTVRWRGVNTPHQAFMDFLATLNAAPAVTTDAVYVTSYEGTLHALDAATGQERWHFTTGEYMDASPVVANGLVYVGHFNGAVSNGLVAVDAATGQERWSFATGAEVTSAPAVTDGTVYVGDGASTLYALDAATGQERWRFATRGMVIASPVVVDGTVYVGDWGDTLSAVDAGSGRKLWQVSTRGPISAAPVMAGGVLYVVANADALYAVDAATGTPRWRAQLAGPDDARRHGFVEYGLSVVDGVAYVSGTDNLLRAIDTATQGERWRFAVAVIADDLLTVAAPAVADGVVYVGSRDGRLYAVDAATGTARWHFQTGEVIRGSAVVDGGVIYVGSDDGILYALAAPAAPVGR